MTGKIGAPARSGGGAVPGIRAWVHRVGAVLRRVRDQFRAGPGTEAKSPAITPRRSRKRKGRRATARLLSQTYTGAAGSRAFQLYVPSRRDDRPAPLVVMLHGCTQTTEEFAAATRMNEIAEEAGFLVAYPAQARSANSSGCWNWFNPADQRRDGGEPELIAGITRQIMRDHRVAPEQDYVAGLSAGGAAAAIMGARYPDLYAAIGVHSGLACGAASGPISALLAMKRGSATGSAGSDGDRVPTIVFHGSHDTTVHPVNGERVIDGANMRASPGRARLVVRSERGVTADGMSFTRTAHIESTGRSLLEHWLVEGAGHAWSGGSAGGSYSEPRGPDASREMIRFFRQHILPERRLGAGAPMTAQPIASLPTASPY